MLPCALISWPKFQGLTGKPAKLFWCKNYHHRFQPFCGHWFESIKRTNFSFATAILWTMVKKTSLSQYKKCNMFDQILMCIRHTCAHSIFCVHTCTYTLDSLVLYINLLPRKSSKCDPTSQNQQKVACPVLCYVWLKIGDLGQHGRFLGLGITYTFWKSNPSFFYIILKFGSIKCIWSSGFCCFSLDTNIFFGLMLVVIMCPFNFLTTLIISLTLNPYHFLKRAS